MNGAMGSILAKLAAGTPKIYIRTTTWRASKASGADDRIAFRISTHAMYNDWDEIDLMFERLVSEVDAVGLPQLG
jgi:isopenicillin-N epimerase